MPMRFEDLRVWREARALTRQTDEITRRESFAADWALSMQMRRAAVSIMANIAEGFERRASSAEFARFLRMAKGSCGELRCHLYVANDQRYLAAADRDRVGTAAVGVSPMLGALIEAVRRDGRKVGDEGRKTKDKR